MAEEVAAQDLRRSSMEENIAPGDESYDADDTPSKPRGQRGSNRYSAINTSMLSDYQSTASPSQAKRALEAHMLETDRRLDEAHKLGTALINQRNELTERMKEVEKAQSERELGPELRQKLDEVEKEYHELGRDTARAFLAPRRGHASEDFSQDENVNVFRSASPTKFNARATDSPSKMSAPSRKQRNQAGSRVHDIEFATEISTSLLAQVRQLQAALSERDESLKAVTSEKERLLLDMQTHSLRLRSLDESEQQYKDENWTLETQRQELLSSQKDAAEREQRLQHALAVANSEKSAAQRELDEMKQAHGKLSEETTSLRKTHDTELGSLRKSINFAESHKASLKKKLEELTSQNQELANFIASRPKSTEPALEGEHLSEPDDLALEKSDAEHQSPPGSPVKGARNSMLESETLKTSLAHAHRMIQNLKSTVHREKTEKLDLKRQLQDSRDELDIRRQSTVAGKKGKARDLKHQTSKPGQLGGSRASNTEIIQGGEWEDSEADPTPKRAPGTSRWDPASGAESTDAYATANETDAFDTANETETDGFETATERDAPTDNEFVTGAESADSGGDATETEDSGVGRQGTIRARPTPNRPMHRSRDSFHSTASTSDEDDHTPARSSRYGSAIFRSKPGGSRWSIMGGSSAQSSNKGSPASFAAPPGQSLGDELGDFMDDDSIEGGSVGDSNTPSRNLRQFSRSGTPHRTPSKRSLGPLGDGIVLQPTPSLPPVPKLPMVDSGNMTEPWVPEPEIHTKEVPVPYETIREVEVVKEVPVDRIVEVQVPAPRKPESTCSVMTDAWEPEPKIVTKEIPVPFETVREVEVVKEVPVDREVIKEVPVIQYVDREVIKEIPIDREVIKEVPVDREVLKEVVKEVPVVQYVDREVIKEVPVEREVIKEVPVVEYVDREVIKEVPVDREVIKEVEKIKYVDREVIKEVPVEREVIREVPVDREVVKEMPTIQYVEKEVIKEVPVEREVIKEVPVDREVIKEVIKEVQVDREVIKEVPKIEYVEREVIKEVPVEREVIKEVTKIEYVDREVIKEVPVDREVIKEVPVVEYVDREVIKEVPVDREIIKEIPKIEYVDREVIKEVPVDREVIKEVPTIQYVDREVIKEVPVDREVIREVVREVEVPAAPIDKDVSHSGTSMTPRKAAFAESTPPANVLPTPEDTPVNSIANLRSLDEPGVDVRQPETSLFAPGPLSRKLELSSVRSVSIEPSETDVKQPATASKDGAFSFAPVYTPSNPPPEAGEEPSRPSTAVKDGDNHTAEKIAGAGIIGGTLGWIGGKVSSAMGGHSEEPIGKKALGETSNNAAGKARELVQPGQAVGAPSANDDVFAPTPIRPSRAGVVSPGPVSPKPTLPSKSVRRPGSVNSIRRGDEMPPLPADHQKVIEAASKRNTAELPKSVTMGAMGPPAIPASAMRSVSRTGSYRVVSNEHATPTAVRIPPRTSQMRSARSLNSRRSSISSFESDIDNRFHLRYAMGGAVPGIDGATDPRMIQAITQTMIGEYLWKYTRKAGGTKMSANRHRRFFWVHPYTRTLYWSEQDPATAGRAQLKAKSVQIEAVRVVQDDNPFPPGLHRKSLVVLTPNGGRDLKFTAPTGMRHETWFNSLSYLLLRQNPDAAQESVAAHQDFNPNQVSMGKDMRAENDRMSLSTYNSRPATARMSRASSVNRIASPVRGGNSSIISGSPATVRRHPPGGAGGQPPAPPSRGQDFNPRAGAGRQSMSLSSRISSVLRPGRTSISGQQPSEAGEGSIYNASVVHSESAEDLRERYDTVDENGALENVRACCDGKHDVGAIPRRAGSRVSGLHHHHH